jgi:hypothetical protein
VRARKKPVIDQFRPRHSKMMYGAPCGGLGSGTIGRYVADPDPGYGIGK